MDIGKALNALTTAAASRNYVSAVTGFGGALVFLGVIDQDSSKSLIEGVQHMMNGLGEFVLGAKQVYLVAVPVALAIIAKFAGNSQQASTQAVADAKSLPNQLKAITSNPDVVVQGKIIVADPAVAEAVPSPQVVAPH